VWYLQSVVLIAEAVVGVGLQQVDPVVAAPHVLRGVVAGRRQQRGPAVGVGAVVARVQQAVGVPDQPQGVAHAVCVEVHSSGGVLDSLHGVEAWGVIGSSDGRMDHSHGRYGCPESEAQACGCLQLHGQLEMGCRELQVSPQLNACIPLLASFMRKVNGMQPAVRASLLHQRFQQTVAPTSSTALLCPSAAHAACARPPVSLRMQHVGRSKYATSNTLHSTPQGQTGGPSPTATCYIEMDGALTRSLKHHHHGPLRQPLYQNLA
jgi:hypothetical protein